MKWIKKLYFLAILKLKNTNFTNTKTQTLHTMQPLTE